MKFVQLNFSLVSSALHAHETTGTPVPFNTSFHSATEAPGLVRPSDAPYSFKRWLPLILRTRQHPPQQPQSPATASSSTSQTTPQPDRKPTAPPANTPDPGRGTTLQTLALTRAQAQLLHDATAASILLRRINSVYAEDLAENMLPLLRTHLVFPPQGLFLRLDACSPKDGEGPPSSRGGALRTAEEVLLLLVTSVRARNALAHWLAEHPSHGESTGGGGGEGGGGVEAGFELFFLPFDARMDGGREYRVFCAPVDGRVVGVSQYRWYRPWRFQGVGEEEERRVVERVRRGAEEMREMILAEAEMRRERGDELLLEQGFSFDLCYDEETDACLLVELNTFGARSACGSCLFQWVDDREVLYGEQEAEFRVAVDMMGTDGMPGPPAVRVSRMTVDGEDGVGTSECCEEDWRAFVRAA